MTRRRSLSVVLGFVLVVLVCGFVVLSKFAPQLVPGVFDRESADPAELAALDAAPLAEATRGTDWPQWLGPTRDGRAPAGPLRTDLAAKPPKLLWSVPCGGGHSSFAVVRDLLVTQDYAAGVERVLGLNKGTGAVEWSVSVPVDYAGIDRDFANGPRATPSISGGFVFAVTADGQLLAVTIPAKGAAATVAWRHDLIGEYGAPRPTWGCPARRSPTGTRSSSSPGRRVPCSSPSTARPGRNSGGPPGTRSATVRRPSPPWPASRR